MKAGLMIGLGLWFVVWMSACSFKVEMGYHGQSGRDDRTQTQLIKTKSEKY